MGSDSLRRSDLRRRGWDDGVWAGAVRRPPPGKRGAFLHRRLVEVGEAGVAVRRLGGDRAGEMRLTRFLRNPKVSAEAIVAEAARRTRERVAGRHVVAIEDTTSLRGEGGKRSLHAHPTLVADAENGAPLGLLHTSFLLRAGGRRRSRKRRSFDDKESRCWLAGAEAAAGLGAAGARCVTVVADRECDIYEMFALKPAGVELVVRAAQDRALDGGERLFERLAGEPEAGRCAVELPAAPGRRARRAELAVRFSSAAIRRPRSRVAAGDLPKSVAVSLVEAREVDPPAGEAPAHWRLITTHRVDAFAKARFIAELYRRRWLIEELFRILKTRGFDIERVGIAEAPFEKLAAAALVAAISVLALVKERDGAQKRPLADVFEADEQAALEAVSATLEGKTARQKNPHPRGTLAFAAWVCARLGGWTGYYGKPGPIVMLNGLHRFRAIQHGWSLAQNV